MQMTQSLTETLYYNVSVSDCVICILPFQLRYRCDDIAMSCSSIFVRVLLVDWGRGWGEARPLPPKYANVLHGVICAMLTRCVRSGP